MNKVFAETNNFLLKYFDNKNTAKPTSCWNKAILAKKSAASNFSTIKNVVKTAFIESIRLLCEKISALFRQIFPKDQEDKNRLFVTDHKVASSEYEWTLNQALLKSAYERSNNDELKRQIEFLSTNYLGTAAPIYMNVMRALIPGIEENFQLNPQKNSPYHRYGFMDNLAVGSSINKSFAMHDKSPLIPTDTDKFEEFLPLSFTLLTKNNEGKRTIKETIKSHLELNPKEGLTKPLERSFLFDLTDRLKDFIQTDDNNDKEREFKKRFDEIQKEIKQEVAEAARELQIELNLSDEEIKKFIHANSTTICRVKLRGREVSGVKFLPLFTDITGHKLRETQGAFLNFLSSTGLYIGALNMRRTMARSLQEDKAANYTVRKGNRDAIFFEDKDSFINSALFVRLSHKTKISEFQNKNPQSAVLLNSILGLLHGLFSEIDEDQWQFINQIGSSREILQTTLFRLREHLASAELYAEIDFAKFTKSIELAHADMAILLELTHPFKNEDFSEIYKRNLQVVPRGLQDFVIAGLGRTGVNLFAAANAAIHENNPNPSRAYGKGFYFEQAGFIGYDNKIDELLQDPEKARKVDLYACQFNPNIDIETNHTHYEVGSVAQDIKALLQDRNKDLDPPLTVTLDCTIDFINSNKVKELLAEFEDEIKSGTLNFVFFKSGQKLDMFGMDHYYGAPFFMVNNNDPKWDSFKKMLQSDAVRTDSLSQQWFCLSNKYAGRELDSYRKLIFNNTRTILDSCPHNLIPDHTNVDQNFTVSTAENKMDACFIDIKVKGTLHKLRAASLMGRFYLKATEQGIKTHSRASFGFCHPNFIVIMIQEVTDSTTIRLSPGINPQENEFIIEYLKTLSEEQEENPV